MMETQTHTHTVEPKMTYPRNKHQKRSKMNLETQLEAETSEHRTSRTKRKAKKRKQRKMDSPVLSSSGGKSYLTAKTSRVHVCEDCGYVASQPSHLKQHMLTHSGHKVFHCKQCQSAFKHPHYLKRHMRIHSGEKPYCCKDCGANFTHYYSWQIHLKTHTGEKPYLCMECGVAFAEPSNLQRHMQTHTGERPFLCSQCGVAFARAGNLKTHMRVHTGEKPFSCPQCKATFSRLTNMELHMRSHTGEKPFQCQECGAKLSSSGALKTHRRIHTGEKPFCCHECDSCFRQIAHLQKHMKIHHAGEQWVSDKQSKIKQACYKTNKRADHTSSDDCQRSPRNTNLTAVTLQSADSADAASKTCPKQGSLERHQPHAPQQSTIKGLSMAEQICLQTLVSIHSQEMPVQSGTWIENSSPKQSKEKCVPNVPQTQNVTQVQNVSAFHSQEQPVPNVNAVLHNGAINTPSTVAPYHSKECHESSGLLVNTQMSAECPVMTGSLSHKTEAGSEKQLVSCGENSSGQHMIVSSQTEGQPLVTVKTGNVQHWTVGSENQHVPAMYSGGDQDLMLSGHMSEREPPTEKQCQQTVEPKKCYQRPQSMGTSAQTDFPAGQLFVQSGVTESGYDLMKASTMPGDRPYLAEKLPSQTNSGEKGNLFLGSTCVSQAKPASAEEMPFPTAEREVSAGSSDSDGDAGCLENCAGGLLLQDEDSDSTSSSSHDSQWPAHAERKRQNTKPTSTGVESNGRNGNSVNKQREQSSLCSRTMLEATFPKTNRREETVEGNNSPEKDCTDPSNIIMHLSATGSTPLKDTVHSSTIINQNRPQKDIKSQVNDKPFLCSQCGTDFTRAGNLKTHMAIHTGEKPYTCTHCQAAFNRPWNLKLHMRSHTGEKPFCCKQCGTSFGTTGALKTHLRIHTGEKPFSCHDCGASFRLMRQLQKHIIVQHSLWSAGKISCIGLHTEKRPFSCTECDVSFQYKNSLQVHRKTHTKEKPYQCKECGCCFTERSNLQRHIVTHTGERPFLCAQCGAAFSRAGNLKSHMSVHSGDKPFTCLKCHAQFNRSWNLKLHLRSHTGEKAFPCHQCGASLSSAGALKTHMRIHTGEKPFVCKICDTAFRQTGQLQKHMRIHHSF